MPYNNLGKLIVKIYESYNGWHKGIRNPKPEYIISQSSRAIYILLNKVRSDKRQNNGVNKLRAHNLNSQTNLIECRSIIFLISRQPRDEP